MAMSIEGLGISREVFTGSVQILASLALALKTLCAESGSVIEGEFYARVMQHLSLQQFNAALDTLRRCGLIQVKGHVITWTEGSR